MSLTITEQQLPEKLTDLRGIGPALAQRLTKLNIDRPIDFLFFLPLRYEDRTRLTPIGALRPGVRAVVEGEVELTEVVYRRRRSLLCRISDGTGQLTLRFFYFSRSQQNHLVRGARIRCYGEARLGLGGFECIHPEYKVLRPEEQPELENRLTPIYSTTEGLAQLRLRKLVQQVVDQYVQNVPDWLSAVDQRYIDELGFPALEDAIRYVHQPPPEADLAQLASGQHPCQRRLAFEEMLAHHLSLRRVRERSQREASPPLPAASELRDRFLGSLGFELTGGQQQALTDIDSDLAAAHPMMRLVQGDVGCGKTVVAAAAALTAVATGHQVAIMAPTELLAEQHRKSFQRWFAPMDLKVVWLSGSLRKKARDQAYADIASGEGQIIIGTHALFQEGVDYKSLALVIVDEQHRFGVHQRLQLVDKGRGKPWRPHQLVMTATPIPRTLTMTMYADLETSVIRELPPGRQPVQTVALPDQRRAEIVQRVREACTNGQRAYWVCPLIEESEILRYQSAETTHAALVEALPDITVGLIHGRIRGDEKERTMHAFAKGEIQVLVATTVIEVGVDVPEASLMIIENAERMGLSQLHQLRGRVGRGEATSTCVLLYRSPMSQLAKRRLSVMRETTDGFKVAQKDLELRGPGEVLGIRQTGLMQLRVADLIRDADLAPAIQQIGRRLIDEAPETVDRIIRRWIGSGSRYSNV
jgi:ATP-dependent DNA helicase RecG